MDRQSDDKQDIESSQDEILMKKSYAYPDPDHPHLQHEIYKKREFYGHRIPPRPNVDDYNDIKEYRDNICARHFTLHEHQAMISNFINPDTPYKGILIFHGLGTGKCVHKDSLVSINSKKVKSIETIWDTYHTESIMIDSDGGQWSMPSKKMYVDSYDEKRNIILKKLVIRLYREHVNTVLKKITCENGSSVTITAIHKLLTQNGWTNELHVGDKIKCFNDEAYYPSESQIISIDTVQYNDYVYDLEIDETHNYVTNNIICHNTCVGVAIAEKFKTLVQKYNTKIIILVSGPLIKEMWKQHLLICTGETYLKYQDKSVYIDAVEKQKLEKNALIQALQFYKFMSYRSFYKHVLGEKIVDKKVIKGTKVRVSYRKTDEGEFERDISVDRIYNLNNTVIVVDEAHNLTGNAYGDALTHIIENSINLKLVLMSGTPMKNLADDVVELINFIRPRDAQIERDKIFNSNKNHLMEFKAGGQEYLRKMLKGYISHVRGADPLIFAKRVDKGIKPPELLFTKVTRCKMLDLQRTTYDTAVREQDDTLDRRSEAVANFVFPGLTTDRKEITGYYGREGLNIVKNQLKISQDTLNKKISELLYGHPNETEMLHMSQNGKTLSGKILKMENLKYFSTKFYKAIKKLQRLVWGKKGAKTAFIYSNLVKVGIELFEEILIQNGYLEYQEDAANYQIASNTICYYCGKTHGEHQNRFSGRHYDTDSDSSADLSSITSTSTPVSNKLPNLKRSDSSSDYKEYNTFNTLTSVPYHQFHPATFISVTGKSSEENADAIPEEKKKILDQAFNTIENKEGKLLKFVLGSKVMNEGISLKHVGEVHILDVYFNLGKVDQVVGRGIRWCSHYKLMNEENVYPKVNVYKYVVALDGALSTEEELYKKAEMKYTLIKKVERIMKEVAIDCPLNVYGNMFKEEMEFYKNCDKDENNPCPTLCDYTKCDYKCDDYVLNAEFYDPDRKIYKNISKEKLDYSTFTHGLARNEIDYAKNKIKDLYITNYMYVIQDILSYVKLSYPEEKRELFDEFFVFKALDELIPMTENDFNNFKDTIIDKHNRPGYLIYINKYYIFQPFDQNEDVPMYYRTTNTQHVSQQLSLYNYLKNNVQYKQIRDSDSKKTPKIIIKDDAPYYNFEDALEYYDDRDEYDYVGYIDKEVSRRKNKSADEIKDVFKLREKRAKILEKKRGTGIPSLQGAVCSTSKSKKYLQKVAKKLGVTDATGETRTDVCAKIENRMLYLEKYGTKKDGNKFTYVMIPINHPMYQFPYNLEDRVEHIVAKLGREIKFKLSTSVKQKKQTTGQFKGEDMYIITIKDDAKLKEYEHVLTKLNAKKSKGEWTIIVE